MKGRSAMAAGAFAAFLGGAPLALADEVVLGTGEHRAAGRALCRLVERAEIGVDCRLAITPDDAHNLDNVRIGALDFALVDSESLAAALARTGPFAFTDASFEEIREVLALPGRVFALVARADAHVASVADLAGHRVNLGAPATPERRMMLAVLAAAGLERDRLALAEELPQGQQSLALCHGRIQAAGFFQPSPAAEVGRLTRLCEARVVGLDADTRNALLGAAPYLGAARIGPGGEPDGALATVASRLVLITAADLDAETVAAVAGAILDGAERLGRMLPGLGALAPAEMIRGAGLAPRHPGTDALARALGMT